MNEDSFNQYLNKTYEVESQRFALLQNLANKYGDFQVTHSYINQKGDKIFSKWRSVNELSEKQYVPKVSHRQILPFEIVLDIDEPNKLEQSKRLFKSLAYFLSLKCDLFLFSTGSKGYHIHIFAISDFKQDTYKRHKTNNFLLQLENIIKKYSNIFGLDCLKISRNVLIALEFAPHWKSQKQKKILLGRGLFYEKNRIL